MNFLTTRGAPGAHHSVWCSLLLHAHQKRGRVPVERIVSSPERVRKTKLAGADRRRQLVSIAINHIALKGFEGLRFQEVAEEAGINNATLYHYFPAKKSADSGSRQPGDGRVKAASGATKPRLPRTPARNCESSLRAYANSYARSQSSLSYSPNWHCARCATQPSRKSARVAMTFGGAICAGSSSAASRRACFGLRSISTLQ
jgi:hypothetical protein